MDSTTDRSVPAASATRLTADDRAPLLPPGPSLPRSVQGVGFGLARRRVLQRLQARYGDAVTVHLPIYGRAVVISDPALAKALFTAPQESLTNIDPNLGRVLGEQSMFAIEGTDHRRHRKLLTPPLHGRRITGYEAVVEEETRRELGSWVVDRPFASLPSMTRITLDIIIRTVFGARDDELVTLRRVIPPMVEAGSAVVITPELPVRVGAVAVGSVGPRARFARYKKVYDDAITALIARGRRDDRLDERDDILAMMLQSTYDDGSSMTDEEIRDELTALLVAGHETTATTLAWALERLSRNPAVLDELVAEVDDGGAGYRHATILEVQRSRAGHRSRRAPRAGAAPRPGPVAHPARVQRVGRDLAAARRQRALRPARTFRPDPLPRHHAAAGLAAVRRRDQAVHRCGVRDHGDGRRAPHSAEHVRDRPDHRSRREVALPRRRVRSAPRRADHRPASVNRRPQHHEGFAPVTEVG